MPKIKMDGVIFDIVTSTQTTTALAEKHGWTYQQVAKLRKNKKYQQLWHLRRALHNQEDI